MTVAFRKVWRDLWNNKGRTFLVVVSIAVGVMALGMITASNTIVAGQMTVSQEASRPAHVILGLRGLVDEDTVRSIARLPEVAEAEGSASAGIRWKPTLDAEWQDAALIMRGDYENQIFDLIQLRDGEWPDGRRVAVEFDQMSPYGVPPIGGAIYFEVNNRPKAVILGGIVRDPQQFPPPFTSQPAFYVSRSMLAELAGWSDYNEIRFTIPQYSKVLAESAADTVESKLIKIGLSSGVPFIQDPQRHFLQDMMDGVGLVLAVMAVLSLGMSTILVINTMNAIIAQQVPQIGIMKTVGGLRDQIATLYLVGVAVYGVLSLMIAVPLGALGGDALARWMLAFINIPASPFGLLRQSLLYQIGAGLVTPLLAALWPVLQGVAVSVREAIAAYGVGSGRYGARWLDKFVSGIQGLPRMALLSLRNTFRRAGRAALTQITLTTAGAIFMMVVSTHYSFNKTIDQIFYSFGFDVLIGFENTQRIDEIVPLLESRPGVKRAEMWIFRSAAIKKPGAEGPGSKFDARLRGIPADTVLFAPELTAGRDLLPTDGHALVLNQKLAGDMGVTVGDQVTLDLDDAGESTWRVVGLILDLGGEQKTAYLHRDTLNEELGQVGRATIAEIQVSPAGRETQQAVEKDLRDYFQSLGMDLNFSETATENREQANAQFSILTTLLLIMTLVIAVVGSIGLSGTLSINVLERRREIGVMRAVGASSLDVALIFMGEGLVLGLLSWAAAIPISVLAGRYFVLAIGKVIDFPVAYYYSFGSIWIWLGIVVALSLVASWLPARRATRISVQESLAYE